LAEPTAVVGSWKFSWQKHIYKWFDHGTRMGIFIGIFIGICWGIETIICVGI
jgi:hypothetical protein